MFRELDEDIWETLACFSILIVESLDRGCGHDVVTARCTGWEERLLVDARISQCFQR